MNNYRAYLRQAETPPPVLAVSPIKCVPALLPSHREPFEAFDLPHAQTFSSDHSVPLPCQIVASPILMTPTVPPDCCFPQLS